MVPADRPRGDGPRPPLRGSRPGPRPPGERDGPGRLDAERLIAELRGLGMDVEIQASSRVVGDRYRLHNLLARLPGTPEGGRPLVLCTHYDSVAAGPGAADAGSGEVA